MSSLVMMMFESFCDLTRDDKILWENGQVGEDNPFELSNTNPSQGWIKGMNSFTQRANLLLHCNNLEIREERWCFLFRSNKLNSFKWAWIQTHNPYWFHSSWAENTILPVPIRLWLHEPARNDQKQFTSWFFLHLLEHQPNACPCRQRGASWFPSWFLPKAWSLASWCRSLSSLFITVLVKVG